MGQSLGIPGLPLPQRIPKPTNETKEALNSCGIQVNDESDQEYVTYSLPGGWRTVDNSFMAEYPEFYIVDNNNMVKFKIYGSWKGNYENYLRILTIDKPYEFKPRQEKIIPSRTDTAAVMGTFLQAIDEEHRPPVSVPPKRKEDYTGQLNQSTTYQ